MEKETKVLAGLFTPNTQEMFYYVIKHLEKYWEDAQENKEQLRIEAYFVKKD